MEGFHHIHSTYHKIPEVTQNGLRLEAGEIINLYLIWVQGGTGTVSQLGPNASYTLVVTDSDSNSATVGIGCISSVEDTIV